MTSFGRSFQIGQFANIAVKVHWSFGLILIFVLFSGLISGLSSVEIIKLFVALFVLFFCVILHEYGHAITARKYQVETKDIIISPIGGVARLGELPNNPAAEFWIALAGPLVNVIIALITSLILWLIYGTMPGSFGWRMESIKGPENFLSYLVQINLALFLFNLIPAFPMDGGRILRALLSFKLGRTESTKYSAILGKLIAFIFVVVGISKGLLILGIIGFVIYYMARQEYQFLLIKEGLLNTAIQQIARKNFSKVYTTDLMSHAAQISEHKKENHFLVFDPQNNPVGILHNLFIKESIKTHDVLSPVRKYTSNKLFMLDDQKSIEKAKELMQQKGLSIIGTTNNNQLNAVIDRDDIIRFIKQLRKKN